MDSESIEDLVRRSLAEDVGAGDVTGEAIVASGKRAAAELIQKQPGVLFGFAVAAECFRQLDPECRWRELAAEGEWRDDTPAIAARIEGSARALLAAERTALNFLGHLSGVATLTARFVRAAEGTGVRILDTRKTTPGLRELEKAAVRAGGGENHRFGLYDAVLVKENHIALAGGAGEAARRALAGAGGLSVEIECTTLAEARAAVDAGATRLLLDNMSPEQLREVAAAVGERAEIEASGGVTLDKIGEIAASGVNFVSIGALTHSAPALDLSLGIESL